MSKPISSTNFINTSSLNLPAKTIHDLPEELIITITKLAGDLVKTSCVNRLWYITSLRVYANRKLKYICKLSDIFRLNIQDPEIVNNLDKLVLEKKRFPLVRLEKELPSLVSLTEVKLNFNKFPDQVIELFENLSWEDLVKVGNAIAPERKYLKIVQKMGPLLIEKMYPEPVEDLALLKEKGLYYADFRIMHKVIEIGKRLGEGSKPFFEEVVAYYDSENFQKMDPKIKLSVILQIIDYLPENSALREKYAPRRAE